MKRTRSPHPLLPPRLMMKAWVLIHLIIYTAKSGKDKISFSHKKPLKERKSLYNCIIYILYIYIFNVTY